jgi:hypothetical protein
VSYQCPRGGGDRNRAEKGYRIAVCDARVSALRSVISALFEVVVVVFFFFADLLVCFYA